LTFFLAVDVYRGVGFDLLGGVRGGFQNSPAYARASSRRKYVLSTNLYGKNRVMHRLCTGYAQALDNKLRSTVK